MNFGVMRTEMQWLMEDDIERIGMEDVARPSKALNLATPVSDLPPNWTITKINLTPIMARRVEVFLAVLIARAAVRGIWNLWVYGSNKHMSEYTFRLTLRSLRQWQTLRSARIITRYSLSDH